MGTLDKGMTRSGSNFTRKGGSGGECGGGLTNRRKRGEATQRGLLAFLSSSLFFYFPLFSDCWTFSFLLSTTSNLLFDPLLPFSARPCTTGRRREGALLLPSPPFDSVGGPNTSFFRGWQGDPPLFPDFLRTGREGSERGGGSTTIATVVGLRRHTGRWQDGRKRGRQTAWQFLGREEREKTMEAQRRQSPRSFLWCGNRQKRGGEAKKGGSQETIWDAENNCSLGEEKEGGKGDGVR